MMIKAQIQFTRHQIQQLDELLRLKSATRTELVLRAVDYYIHGIGELCLKPVLQSSPTSETREVPRPLRAHPSVTSTHLSQAKKAKAMSLHTRIDERDTA